MEHRATENVTLIVLCFFLTLANSGFAIDACRKLWKIVKWFLICWNKLTYEPQMIEVITFDFKTPLGYQKLLSPDKKTDTVKHHI